MKQAKFLTITFSVVFVLIIIVYPKAQDWPVGTIWVYDQIDFGPPDFNNYQIIKVVGDTIVNGLPSKKLSSFYWHSTSDTSQLKNLKYDEIIYYDGGKVYLLDPDSSKFYLIYNFNVVTGDTVSYYIRDNITGGNETFNTYVIEFENIVKTSGPFKRRVYLDKISQHCFDYYGPIIEDIGCQFYFFQNYCAVDPPNGGFLECFSNGTISYPDGINCNIPVSNDNPWIYQNIALAPNPAKDMISLSLPSEIIIDINILNINGIKQTLIANHHVYDISSYPAGIYFMELFHNNFKKYLKFVKL